MEFQLILVLIIAFIILGPERMMDLAFKMGEALRKVREMWDEVRMQAYVENINKSIMEAEQNEGEAGDSEDLDEYAEDLKEEDYEYVPDELNEDIEDEFEEPEESSETQEEETLEDGSERGTSGDAPDGAPEGAPKQTD